MSARLFAPAGTPLQASGGEVSEPSQVYFAGIDPWWLKLDEVICMRASGGLARARESGSASSPRTRGKLIGARAGARLIGAASLSAPLRIGMAPLPRGA